MSRRLFFGVGGLAAATLLLETAFLRLLSVAQFYHFAFLVVSLALLGFGASGSFLAAFRKLQNTPADRLLQASSLGFAASIIVAYGAVNLLPFDSFSITWDPRQIIWFILYFLALGLPFIFSGLGIGACLAAAGPLSHMMYAANLLGSAIGVLLGLVVMEISGVPGALIVSAIIPVSPAFANRIVTRLGVLGGLTALVWLSVANASGGSPVGLTLSPYKGLAYARQYPGSVHIFGAWSAISRVDVMAGAGTRIFPGLSYTFRDGLPPQAGLSVDGDTIVPISLTSPDDFIPWEYLPEGVAFNLVPASQALILEPGAGLGVNIALAGGASRVTVVSGDPLIARAVRQAAPAYDVFNNPAVSLFTQSPRVFLETSRPIYNIVYLPLVDGYRPVTSGAYSLSENYLLTVEGLAAALDALSPDGVLVATRWLQVPPSECLRLVATLTEALEARGKVAAAELLVVYRSLQTLTVLVRDEPWSETDLAQIRDFVRDRRYDLVWAPDIQPEEVNRFNQLPTPDYYLGVRDILDRERREGFYQAYPFAVRPARDDRPFFFHFFTWQQAPEILASVGKIWQPFGGSGFFVLFVLLFLVSIFSVVLILLPIIYRERMPLYPGPGIPPARALLYFGSIGIGFLFIEIPLIQKWILILGHPTYAFAGVVFTLLAFSSLGSRYSRGLILSGKGLIGLLALLGLGMPWVTNQLLSLSLGWPAAGRLLAAGLGLAPLAFLMGVPFPLGLAWLEARAPHGIPWAWAVNGCSSVVAGVLAAILSLSAGFSLVLWIGAAAYAVAWVVYPGFNRTRG